MKLNQAKLQKLKWIIYAVILLVLYILQTTPLLFQILGIKPVLLVPFAVCLSLFESEKAAAAYAIAAGLLWDISSNKLFGFRAILLMCCCISVTLLVMYLMRNKLINGLFFVLCVMLIIELLDYVFFYVIWGYSNHHLILLNYLLPTLIYTVIITIPMYFLVRKIAAKFNETLRM